jgi:hypothetical protein
MKNVTGVIVTRFYQKVSLDVEDGATENEIKQAIFSSSDLHGPETESETEILDFKIETGGDK